MFTNNIISFALLNVYAVAAVNLILLVAIYFLLIKDKISSYFYNSTYNKLEPIVRNYMEKGLHKRKLKYDIRKKYHRDIIIDILLSYPEKNNLKLDLNEKFREIGYDDILIKEAETALDLDLIKKLAAICSPKAFEPLKKGLFSEDFDLRYMSYYTMSLLELDKAKLDFLITSIMDSGINRDRIIEIIKNLKLSFQETMEYLKNQSSEIGKIVFIRCIQNYEEIQLEENSEVILEYLEDSKEIKISSIITLCASRNVKYVSKLGELYEVDPWEVRAAIAKGLRNFPLDHARELLTIMVYDEAWWVRFNAAESLIHGGVQGIDILIEVAMDTENKSISDLAYYFLNANKEVYRIIKKIEV